MDVALPPFACRYTPEFPELLAQLDCSLALSTYQAGKVILLSSDGQKITQLPRTFDTPMGLAWNGRQLAVATKHEVMVLGNDIRLAPNYPKKPATYDALLVPFSAHFCGQLNIHDMAWGQDGLVGVNTLFACLFRLEAGCSFVPLWRPPFVTALAPEDRCHLNGMAMDDGRPRYVTALGDTDTQQGWREKKLSGGVLIDVDSGEVVLRGLPMPHSPRLYDGQLYLLLSATGEVAAADPASGRYEVVNRIAGFVRGMARHGDYVFVSTSHLRNTHTFGDLPLAQANATRCGITALHLPTGSRVGQLEYINTCEEIYDVQVLAGLRRPGILGTADPVYRRALSMPEAAFWGAPDERALGRSAVVQPATEGTS